MKLESFTIFAQQSHIEVVADRAVTDFRAFLPKAELHIRHVNDPLAIEVMLEIVEQMKNGLQQRKSVVD